MRTDVSIMTCSKKDKLRLEGELIRKHLPLYNKLVPKKDNPDKPKEALVALNANTNKLLDELCAKRPSEYDRVRTKVSIVEELIVKAHKKECNNDKK